MTKKVIETVNGWYMENPKQKVELDDIIGLVKTDEPTDSVEEVRKLRGRDRTTENKRFTYLNASKTHYIGSFFCNGIPLTNNEVVDLLNKNEQLKQQIKQLQKENFVLRNMD